MVCTTIFFYSVGVDQIGFKEISSGRFISDVTGEIIIIGLCIPRRFAHVSTGWKVVD